MANLTKIYSDIDFTFTKKPVIGDVALSYDELAVVRSIRNLLLTKHYERPFNPDIGSNIHAILFEPISPVTATSLEREVELIIKNYEKRAKLREITIVPYPDKNAYDITISFYIENATLPTSVTLLLERNR
jgi:phage baseplate assembly protein W